MRLPVLSFVSRSEIMTMAHALRRRRLEERGRLQWAIQAGRGPLARRELEAWRPVSMSEALKAAWDAARRRAETRAIEQAQSPAADRLREIRTQITELDGRTRWQSAHYDEMADLRAQQAAAFETVRASLSLQGGQQLPA